MLAAGNSQGTLRPVKKFIRVLILLSVFALALFFLLKGSVALFFYTQRACFSLKSSVNPPRMSIKCDSIFSSDVSVKIGNFTKVFFKKSEISKKNIESLSAQLKEKFGVIKKIEWDFSNPELALLKITGSTPKYLANNLYVIDESGKIFKEELFKDYNVYPLPKIELYLPKERLDELTLENINLIKKENFDVFNVFYSKDTEIFLKQKAPVVIVQDLYPCEIIASTNTVNNFAKIAAAKNIFFKKLNEFYGTKKRGIKFTLDIRFKDKIILRQERIEIAGGA